MHACVRDVFAIYDHNILPRLKIIIIKIVILYFIQIRHTDDFPSTGTRLVILTTNLAECVCVCAKCDPFQPLRFHFFFKLPEFFFRIAKFPYAAFGPLFAFHCPIFFTKNNTLNGVCMLNVTAAHWNNICYWGDYAIVSLRPPWIVDRQWAYSVQRVPDCLGGLSRVGISSRSTRPWNGQPPSVIKRQASWHV